MGTKISAMDAAAALDGTEELAIVQDGDNAKVTAVKLGGGPFADVGSDGTLQYSRAIASSAKDSTGVYTVTLSDSYSIGTIFPVAVCYGSGAKFPTCEIASATSVTVRTFDAAGAASDAEFFVWFVGL